MAVPKRKKSQSKTKMHTRANMKYVLPQVVVDKETGEYTLPHFKKVVKPSSDA
jgi:ribosomal protein L32